MSSKTINIVIIFCLLVSVQFCGASANSKTDEIKKHSALQVYLPREVTIKGDTLSLGQVSIIRGEESLVAKASEISLGRISAPGQGIILDRPTVLSRLVCNGIPASEVTLTGAEKVTVKQQQQIIKGSEFVELANSFLEENPPTDSAYQWELIRTPKDLVIPGASKDIKLSPSLAANTTRNHAKIRIIVSADGKKIGTRDVAFRLKYNCRRAVTLVELDAGTVISPENVRIEKTVSNRPEPANWSGLPFRSALQNGVPNPPYGLVAKHRLSANTVLGTGMVELRKPEVIVGRNNTVIIRVERPGLLITAIGKTMQEGRAGEYIKVRNADSQRIILTKVNEDGTVEPVF